MGVTPSWVRIPLPAPRTHSSGSDSNKARLVELGFFLKRRGLRETTIVPMLKALRILGNRATLQDPEKVRGTITSHPWSDAFKRNLSEAYRHYTEWRGIPWEKLTYKPVDKLPFVPTEAELDSLILSCGPKTCIVLHFLKETGARIGEAWNLKWIDLDLERGIVTITPEKGSYSRQLKISPKLCAMLSRLPRKSPTHTDLHQASGLEI